MLASGSIGEATRVVIVFEVWLSQYLSVPRLALLRGLHHQAWLFKVVIAPAHPVGTSLQTHGEPFDHRLVGYQPAVLQVRGGLAKFGKARLVITEHQYMTLRAMLEVIVDAFFFA